MSRADSENPYQSPLPIEATPLSAPGGRPFKDRSTGLLLFGMLEVLMGAFCGLAVPLVTFVALADPAMRGGSSAAMMVPGIIMYAVLAVVFVTLGIGSMQCQRWARAVNLVMAWMWLVSGVFAMISLLLFMGDFYDRLFADKTMPPEMVLTVKLMVGGILGCLYLFLPGGLVLFYRSPHVKATCEARHPEPCWSDHCPLPVLAASLAMAVTACWLPSALCYNAVMPLFGTFISGIPGGLLALAVSVLLAYLSWAMYRLRPHAWWLTSGCVLLGSASAVLTFARHSMMELYQQMGMPEEQLAMIQKMGVAERVPYAPMIGIYALTALGYLIYVKRYFQFGGRRT